MNATALNAEFASILEAVSAQLSRLDTLREEASDEAWDEATVAQPLGDLLCDLEYEVGNAMEQALQTWFKALPR